MGDITFRQSCNMYPSRLFSSITPDLLLTTIVMILLVAQLMIFSGTQVNAALRQGLVQIEYFEINFTMVHADGSDRHTHEFTNFKRVSVIPIIIDTKGITFIGMT